MRYCFVRVFECKSSACLDWEVPIAGLAMTPDLTSSDFFMQAHVENLIFSVQIQSIYYMKKGLNKLVEL